MITSFVGFITKVLINGQQVYPGDQKIQLPVGKRLTIKISYEVTPYGDIGVLDFWTVGVTAKMGSQFGWDPTSSRGSGVKRFSPEIGNLEVPAGGGTLVIKLWAIDAVNPSAPSG